jgi:hypothetical protein
MQSMVAASRTAKWDSGKRVHERGVLDISAYGWGLVNPMELAYFSDVVL